MNNFILWVRNLVQNFWLAKNEQLFYAHTRLVTRPIFAPRIYQNLNEQNFTDGIIIKPGTVITVLWEEKHPRTTDKTWKIKAGVNFNFVLTRWQLLEQTKVISE